MPSGGQVTADETTRQPSPAEESLRQGWIDTLSQRLAIHLSQEVWQRLFHGTGRGGIGFAQAPLAVLFIESLAGEGQRGLQDDFLAALERLAREHGGTVDAFAWGGSLVFFAHVAGAVRAAVELQRAVPEWKLRMGIHHGECLIARFRSAGGTHATLLGPESAEAATVATSNDYGSIGLSQQAHREWMAARSAAVARGSSSTGLTGAAPLSSATDDIAAAGPWRCERNGNGSMRLAPTNRQWRTA